MSATPSSGVTPAAAWQLLASGNDRFVAGTPRHPHQSGWRRSEVSGGQNPFATVLCCSDSRVSPEIVFDRGLGDIFAVRTAGQILDSAVLGTLEYGVEHTGTPLLVVMGHQSCGCIKAALESAHTGAEPEGHVAHLVEGVAPAMAVCREIGLTNPDEVMEEHVRQIVHAMMDRSELISSAVAAGTLAIAGVTYRLQDGKIALLDWIGDIGMGKGHTVPATTVHAQGAAAASAVAVVDSRHLADTVEAEVVEDDVTPARS